MISTVVKLIWAAAVTQTYRTCYVWKDMKLKLFSKVTHETVKHIKDSHRGNDPETPQLNRDTHWSCKPSHTHRSHVASRHYSRSSIQSCALPVGRSVCWTSSRNPVCRNIAFYNPSTLGASSCFTSEFRGPRRMCDKLQGEQVAPQCCRLEFIWLFRWADKRGGGGELGSEEGEAVGSSPKAKPPHTPTGD